MVDTPRFLENPALPRWHLQNQVQFGSVMVPMGKGAVHGAAPMACADLVGVCNGLSVGLQVLKRALHNPKTARRCPCPRVQNCLNWPQRLRRRPHRVYPKRQTLSRFINLRKPRESASRGYKRLASVQVLQHQQSTTNSILSASASFKRPGVVRLRSFTYFNHVR